MEPFVTLVADPPWKYRDQVHRARTQQAKSQHYVGHGADKIRGRRGAEGYYPVMDVDAICALGQPGELAGCPVADNAHLYLWTTNAFLREAFLVMETWGFTYRTLLTWVKPGIGMGYYFRNNTEHVLFGVRGKLRTQRRNCPTAFEAPKSKQHSKKPDAFMEIVESMSPGPYLELFAREQRAGWWAWGNELKKEWAPGS